MVIRGKDTYTHTYLEMLLYLFWFPSIRKSNSRIGKLKAVPKLFMMDGIEAMGYSRYLEMSMDGNKIMTRYKRFDNLPLLCLTPNNCLCIYPLKY